MGSAVGDTSAWHHCDCFKGPHHWCPAGIYVMIYDRAKFECEKWQATFNATTFAEAVPASMSMMVSLLTLYLVPLWSTVNGGLPLPALPFFGVVYMDTDACRPRLATLNCSRALSLVSCFKICTIDWENRGCFTIVDLLQKPLLGLLRILNFGL